jgi:hypothetical protein
MVFRSAGKFAGSTAFVVQRQQAREDFIVRQ